MKKLISVLLAFVLMGALVACNAENADGGSHDTSSETLQNESGGTTTPTDTSADTMQKDDLDGAYSDWKTAYLNFIEKRENTYEFDYLYALVYINADDIPELYAMGAFEAEGDLICSYKDGRVIEQHLGRTGGGKYVERSGLLINQNGHMGSYYDNVYRLDEKGFSQILNASCKETNVHLGNEGYEIKREYFIDGKAVSEDEYHAAVNAAIDLSKTVEFFEKAVSYDVIKQQIEDCELS